MLFLPFLLVKRENLLLPWRDFLKLGIPGLCFALSTLTYFISFGYMNAGISATILFLYPVFTAVIMVLAYHEKIRPAMILAIVLSFAGVVMLHGAEAGGLSPIGTALAVISAFTYALYIVAINRTKIIISNNKLTFYLVFFSVVTTAIYQLLPQNTTTSKREARRWWMNAGALNVDRNVSFCASICSKEGLLIVSKTLAQREG